MPLAQQRLDMTFGGAFAAPAEAGGDFSRRGGRAAVGQRVLDEFQDPALQISNRSHI